MPKLNTDKLVRKFEDDPVPFMAASAGLLMGISKIIEATAHNRGTAAYARDVNRRLAQANIKK